VYVAGGVTGHSSLRSSFCSRHHCSDSAFEGEFLRRALYRHAVPFTGLLRLVWPQFFHLDTEFIGWIGQSDDLADIRVEIDNFEYRNRLTWNWLRTGLMLRVNSARVFALARECLPENSGG